MYIGVVGAGGATTGAFDLEVEQDAERVITALLGGPAFLLLLLRKARSLGA